MSRVLYLMRHAHAGQGPDDRHRKLDGRGIAEAGAAGLHLQAEGIEVVLCSSAVRCVETMYQLRLKDVHVEIHKALYLADSETIRQRVSETDDDVSRVLVIAHSPGIPTLASELAWEHNHQSADRFGCYFPTAHVARFPITGTWADLMSPTIMI